MAVTQDTIRNLSRIVDEKFSVLKWFETNYERIDKMEQIESEVFLEEYAVARAEYMRASVDLQQAMQNFSLRR